MTKVATTEKPAAENVAPMPRKIPTVDPAAVRVDHDGGVTRTLFVRLPVDMILDDLQRPEIWRRCQQDPGMALRQWDHIFAVAYDEAWTATGRVIAADRATAMLGKLTVDQSPARAQSWAYECEHYYGKWVGNGFANFRRADHQRMDSLVYATAEAGRQAMLNLYPTIRRA